MKPNWACTSCGMFSSRRYNVQRHVNNLHKGYGNVVSFIDYLLGRHAGIYLPNYRPTYQRKENYRSQIMNEEFYRQIARESAHKASKLNTTNWMSFFGSK